MCQMYPNVLRLKLYTQKTLKFEKNRFPSDSIYVGMGQSVNNQEATQRGPINL